MNRKRKKSLVGYALKNWGMVFQNTKVADFNYAVHDRIYRDKNMVLCKTKVRITIEEL